MTFVEFFNCSLLAFGAPLALFITTIANDPIRIIICVVASFFWLVSYLLSAMFWYAVIPLRDYIAFGMVFAVLFQEASRIPLYLVMRKMEAHVNALNNSETNLMNHKSSSAYVTGLAYGLMSGAFAMMNVLADSSGPGTLGLKSKSEYFFVTSAVFALCMILLNIFWNVIFFSAFDERNLLKIFWVVGSHLLVSGLTLLNSQGLYAVSILMAYVILLINMVWAFKCAGGSYHTLLNSIKHT